MDNDNSNVNTGQRITKQETQIFKNLKLLKKNHKGDNFLSEALISYSTVYIRLLI